MVEVVRMINRENHEEIKRKAAEIDQLVTENKSFKAQQSALMEQVN